MSWMHNGKTCFVILYIILCCFDLELDTVASLPEVNEVLIPVIKSHHSVAKFKSTNLGAHFKKKKFCKNLENETGQAFIRLLIVFHYDISKIILNYGFSRAACQPFRFSDVH